mgnify:CR=1 FL=1
MAQITLNKPSGGQLTIAPEDGTSTETITIPTGGFLSEAPGGTIIQKVSATNTSQIVQSSTTWTEILTINFTPKYANSKIYLHSSMHIGVRDAGEMQFDIRFLRNGATISEKLSSPAANYNDVFRDSTANGGRHLHYDTYAVDMPNTTGTVTYSFQVNCPSDTYPDLYINFYGRAYSTIFVEEVKQ